MLKSCLISVLCFFFFSGEVDPGTLSGQQDLKLRFKYCICSCYMAFITTLVL